MAFSFSRKKTSKKSNIIPGELLQRSNNQKWNSTGAECEQDLHEIEGPYTGKEVTGGQS